MNERNFSASAFKGFLFQYELLNLIRNNPAFYDVQPEVLVDDAHSIDIMAKSNNETFLIECKASPSFTVPRLANIVKQLLHYKNYYSNSRIVIAFPGELTDSQKFELTQNGIDYWDIYKIVDLFRNQIHLIKSPELSEMFTNVRIEEKHIEDDLLNQLKNCVKGRANWQEYQKLCATIFEQLFSPPLGRPILESADYVRANRRDIILPNYCEQGFWYYLRQRYQADYIVIDAKNHSTKISKQYILQMANYLKHYGPGMFGVIIARMGCKESAQHTQREVWMAQQKLIILLDDLDIEQMLKLKKSSNDPAEVIKQRIEDFRLHL